MKVESSPAAIQHYDSAIEALTNENYDLAISHFNACLCSSPDAVMAFLAFCNLDLAIWGKFDFFNREGGSLSDYEAAWSLRAQKCLNKGIEIYDLYKNQFTGDVAEELEKSYQKALESRNNGMSYGAIKYGANGEKQIRDEDAVQRINLPPLQCLDEVFQEQKTESFAQTEKQKPKTFFEIVSNLGSQCGWNVISGGRDEWAILRFSILNRIETVDMFYQATSDEIPFVCFTSEVIPRLKDSPVEEFETVFDNYFLNRNMKTFHGRWGIIKSDEKKEWVFIIKMDINKITVEDFRAAVLEILKERQDFYSYMDF